MAWCCRAPTPKLTDIEQEKNAEAPSPQEMNLLVSTETPVLPTVVQVGCHVSDRPFYPDMHGFVDVSKRFRVSHFSLSACLPVLSARRASNVN